MINTSSTVNTPVKLYFKYTSGQTVFTDFMIIQEGNLVSAPTFSITEIATTGIYVLTYTPLATGRYGFYVFGNFFAFVDVVSRSVFSYLKNIEDEALGSWSWNKQSGKLDMLRQDGTALASFDVVENLTVASRERI